VEPVEPPAGPERGTGEPETHRGAQAAGLIPADLIESNPGIRGGEPCMKGTRVPAADVAELLADGLGWHQVHEYWPSVPLPRNIANCTGTACDCPRLEPFLERREIRSPYSVSFETQLPPFPPATIPNEAMPHLVGFINALKPAHLREAAASLRAIADHMPDTASARELRPGIEYAATLLAHTADDEGDGDG
jgi:uncharacterized protein (DUF433 family)